MSEYQYYEFQTVDRSLTESELETIEKISSRAIVTTHQAIFTYSYGDFRGDPEKILAEYFDMMLYTANWGTKQLIIRLPQDLIDFNQLSQYCVPDFITSYPHDQYIILEIHFDNEEGSGWIEEGTLSKLLPIRNALLNGDYRALYLAWLNCLSYDEIEMNRLEPTVPNNLKQLSSSLKHFVEFFEIDENLIEAVSAASEELINTGSSDPEKLITKLSEIERNEFLLRLLNCEPNLAIKFNKRLAEISSKKSIESKKKSRTVADLLKYAEQIKQDKKRKKREAEEQARIKKLKALAEKEPILWKEINNSIQLKTSKGYDNAVKLLIDLKDLAHYSRKTDVFSKKVSQLYNEFHRLSSLMARLRQNKIIE